MYEQVQIMLAMLLLNIKFILPINAKWELTYIQPHIFVIKGQLVQ